MGSWAEARACSSCASSAASLAKLLLLKNASAIVAFLGCGLLPPPPRITRTKPNSSTSLSPSLFTAKMDLSLTPPLPSATALMLPPLFGHARAVCPGLPHSKHLRSDIAIIGLLHSNFV